MIPSQDTPPSLFELLQADRPAPRHIALHVTVAGSQGQRSYWMTEGGALFFRGLDGELRRATPVQGRRIARGLEMARRSPAFEVVGRVTQADELDLARGLVAN